MDQALQERLRAAGIPHQPEKLLEREGQALWGFRVPADDALDLWEQLKDLSAETGHWPVLLAAPLGRVREDLELDPRPVEEVLRAADAVGPDPEQWIRQDYDDAEQMLAEVDSWHGARPEAVKPVVDLELPVEGDDALHLVLVPAARGSEAAAHLRFGSQGWPLPEHHVAILRVWEQAYGAQVVALGGDELALRIARPPQSDDAALVLAEAQALYTGSACGFDTLEELAAHRRVDEVWQFLWAPGANED